VAADQVENRLLIADEMKGVGHDDSVQVRQVKRPLEIRDPVVDLQLGIALAEPPPLALDRAGVAVDRPDPGAVCQEGGQRQREGAVSRAEVGPVSAASLDPAPDQADEVGLLQF